MRRPPEPLRRRALGALAGLLLVAAACTDDGPSVPERAAEDAPARTTSTTAPPPPSLARVSADPSVLPGDAPSRFTDVVVGARAIVVAGEADGEAALWSSIDGTTFTPALLDPLDFPAGSAVLDLVVTDDGFVAVGRAGSGAAAWVSSDGSAWLRTDLVGGTAADVVIIGELGVTAFGRDGDDLATWVSFDGFGWERVPGGADVFPGDGPAVPVGAHDDGDGFLLVAERAGVAETWTSPDGRTWERSVTTGAELLPAAGAPRPLAVLGAGSTTVVVGAADDPDGRDAAVWTTLAGEPWERVAPSEEVFGGDGAQEARAVVQLGADLVAVGTDEDDLGDVDAVVWTTGAGGGWQRSAEEDGDGLSGPGDQHAEDLAPTREGALVVGWEDTGAGPRAVAWTLEDGQVEPVVPVGGPTLGWQRVPPTEALGGPGEQRLEAVTVRGDGLVAVGSSHRPDAPDGDLDAATWRSEDGLTWERAAGDLGGVGDQRALDVVDVGTGLVAVGTDSGSAAVWRSADGDGWERVAPDEAVFGGDGDQVATAVAAAPGGGLVAVGADGAGDGDGAAWRSSDGGATWARSRPDGGLGGPGPQALRDVLAVGPLLVAVGTDGAEAAAWTSLDGDAWQRVALGPGAAEAVVAGPAGLVAVGSTGAPGARDAAAWRSADGTAWTAVTVDDGSLGAADQEALALVVGATASGEPLLAAVGRTDLGPGDDGASWASPDGRLWTRGSHVEDVYGGDQAQVMAGLAALADDVLVAVGSSGSTPGQRDAAVWITAPAGGGGGVL